MEINKFPFSEFQYQDNAGTSPSTVHQKMPKPTRTTGIIRFNSERAIAYNDGVTSTYYIQRDIVCYGISCRETDKMRKEKIFKKMIVKFYGIKNESRTICIHVPLVWVPKTFLVLLYKSLLSIATKI